MRAEVSRQGVLASLRLRSHRWCWLGALLLCSAPVWAYTVQGNARWPEGVVRFELQLGSASQPLLDGATSFDAVALAAIEQWNREMGKLQIEGVVGSTAPIQQGNRRNNVFFADKAFNRDFGERTLAITFSSWSGTRRIESNVVFNKAEQWNSYRGPVRGSGGRSLIDLRRVALHEFGHALGLDHPDEDGQTVSAIMNSRAGNLDTLTADDVAGVHSLYGMRDGNSGGGVTAPSPSGSAVLSNLSVRSRAGTGERTLIVGFAAIGGERPVLLRGLGPALQEYGVANPLPDPKLTLFRAAAGGGSEIAINDDWGSGSTLAAAFTAAGASPLPVGSRDAAMRTTLPAGVYSAHLTETAGRSGVGLVEVYATGSPAVGGRLVNLSARAEVGRDEDVLIVGFYVAGAGRVRLLIRGVGPGLVAQGVAGVLTDPQLRLFRGSTVIAANDNWETSGADLRAIAERAGAFAFANGSRDAALVVDLEPGAYTAHVSGVNNTTGVALVELYVVAP